MIGIFDLQWTQVNLYFQKRMYIKQNGAIREIFFFSLKVLT